MVMTRITAAAQPGLTPVQTADDEQPTARASAGSAPLGQSAAPAYSTAPAYSALPPPPPVPAPGGYYVYGPMPMPMPMPAPMIEGRTKSEGTATMLSLGTTAGGFLLLAAAGKQQDGGGEMGTLGVLALLIGPSAGHIYAGESGHAVGMTLVRGGAALAFIAGVVKATTSYGSDCIDWCESSGGDRDNGATLMWVGGLSFVAATVYDIMDAPRAARRRNAKERSYGVQPMFVGTSANSRTPGVGFAGKF